MWNRARLAETAAKAFRNRKFVVVSNRQPYVHEERNGHIACISPAGGLTSALKPIVSAVQGTWVAQASGSADRKVSRNGRVSVPPENPTFTLRRLWVPDPLRKGHSDGLANQGLWPLCHNVFQRPVFRDADWDAYKQVNELFAEAVLDEVRGDPAVVFVQDYQLALLPRILKERNPSITVATFWHIPWPEAGMLQTFPWCEELLDGMLGSDLLGFHLRQYCSNFMAGVESILTARVDRQQRAVRYRCAPTLVRDAPISIDFQRQSELAESLAVDAGMHDWRSRLGGATRIGVGIDRCDYTKGIPERLRAVAALLEANPDLHGSFTFVQVAVPTRTDVPQYAQFEREVCAEVDEINRRWATPDWTPVILERRNLGPVEMTALHRLADFCMVTPLHDGMNLVAKEFVASRIDNDGVLILSRFAGAASELTTALHVNPFSEGSLCNAMSEALAMAPGERQWRMMQARSVVRVNNIYRWAGSLVEEVSALITSRSVSSRPVTLDRMVANVA